MNVAQMLFHRGNRGFSFAISRSAKLVLQTALGLYALARRVASLPNVGDDAVADIPPTAAGKLDEYSCLFR